MTDNFELGLSSIPLVAPVVVDRSGQPITGSTTIVVEIRQIGTSNRWDFTSATFKTSGWTTRQGPLSQVDASIDPGVYESTTGWVATSVAAGNYLITYRDTSGAAANLPAYEAVRLGGPADTITTNLNTKIANVTGTASAGAATSITLAGLSSVDDFYRFSYVEITGGTGAGQTRTIVAYVGSTKVATVNRSWATNPDNTSTFAIRASAQPVILDAGLAQAGGASTITLRASSSATDALYVGATVVIMGGTGAGQERVITAYVGSTKVATLATAWTTQPDATSVYALLPVGRSIMVSNLDKTGYGVTSIGTDVIDAASVKADAVAKVQAGLASRATMVFDAEIGESPIGESVYFPYFKNGAAVVGATVTMMISRLGLADPGPGYEFQTLDFSAEIFVPPADNTDPLITMVPVDASTPGVYTAFAYVSGFATNSVKPDVYTVWFFDGAELVGMGRLRAGTTDIVAALPADITSARDHVETAVASGFTEIKGVGWTAGEDDLHAIRARGDVAWVTANLSGLATSANVTDAVTATLAGIVAAHGDGSYVTASVAGLATGADVAAAVAAIEAYGQAHWQTATTVSLNDGALLPVKIGAGFVNAMQASLALEATLTAMKGAGFDGTTDSLRALRVLVSAIPTAGAPSAATIRDAVWAADDDAPAAGTRGWELWRLSQWGTESNPKKIVGNELRLYTPGLGSVLAAVTLHDADGNDIAPGTGEPAQYLP